MTAVHDHASAMGAPDLVHYIATVLLKMTAEVLQQLIPLEEEWRACISRHGSSLGSDSPFIPPSGSELIIHAGGAWKVIYSPNLFPVSAVPGHWRCANGEV